jgi:hypothetical protein
MDESPLSGAPRGHNEYKIGGNVPGMAGNMLCRGALYWYDDE